MLRAISGVGGCAGVGFSRLNFRNRPHPDSKEAGPFGAFRSHHDVAAGLASVPPLAFSAPLSHFRIMHSDFSLFRERLAHACRARSMTHDAAGGAAHHPQWADAAGNAKPTVERMAVKW